MVRPVAVAVCKIAAWGLENPWIDFKWEMKDYGKVFDAIDDCAVDGDMTDEDIATIVESLANAHPSRFVSTALHAVSGVFKSDAIDFEWTITDYEDVFVVMDVMRKEDCITDENLAAFLRALAQSLEPDVEKD